MRTRIAVALGVLIALAAVFCPSLAQQDTKPDKPEKPREFEDFDKVVADAEKFPGLFPLYRKKDRLLMEIAPGQLNKPYLFVVAIARGIGAGELLGGMTWSDGDDWLLQFERIGNRVHIVRKNVRFRAQAGTPVAEAVKSAYTDSILASVRIHAINPANGGIVIDFTDFLLADVPDLASALRGSLGGFYRFDLLRSTLGQVKNFPLNSEIRVSAVYATEQARRIDTVPDARSVTLSVHYSLTALPEAGYRPRLADDRVGYFVTAVKDYSRPTEDTSFVRMINRWRLDKADPKADKSPPKQPLIFYIEKTVPFQYRRYVREGILEWNKAFEKIGFVDAIEVRTQPDDADWDPEDVRYNTFRWITASAAFAIGPSRVNPLTGEIFDADILFDADMIRIWQQEWEQFHDPKPKSDAMQGWDNRARCGCCDLMTERTRDLARGGAILTLREATPDGRLPEELIGQAIKETVMHEVGHTLGLRHNFKGSTWRKAEELHDAAKTRVEGLSGSVMDYNPVNIAPKGTKQGEFYSTTLGPYDYWAIEYGYKPITAISSEAELPELRKIAARGAEKGLAYATDEDVRGIDPDPLANRWDLGDDPLAYARTEAAIIEELWQGKIFERAVRPGMGYQRLRQLFSILLGHYGMCLDFAARYVGGKEFHRDHKGDPNGRTPFVVVPAAKQREALAFLKEKAFSDKAFQFSPELLNSLAPERWMHWGMRDPIRLDFPIHDHVLRVQSRALYRLFSPLTLSRILDNERKCPPGEDCLTLPEVFREVTAAVWSELNEKPGKAATNRQPFISSYHRALQREYLKLLVSMSLKPSPGTPEDARTQAWSTLRRLDRQIDHVLKQHDALLDDYSRAHLEESQVRIQRALAASFQQE